MAPDTGSSPNVWKKAPSVGPPTSRATAANSCSNPLRSPCSQTASTCAKEHSAHGMKPVEIKIIFVRIGMLLASLDGSKHQSNRSPNWPLESPNSKPSLRCRKASSQPYSSASTARRAKRWTTTNSSWSSSRTRQKSPKPPMETQSHWRLKSPSPRHPRPRPATAAPTS